MKENKQLILYVNPSWRRNRIHSMLLNPWWGNPYEEISVFSRQMFDAYSLDTSCYKITDKIEGADMVFAPYNHKCLLNLEKDLFAECMKISHDHNLPLLIDGSGDIEYSVPERNIYVLRYGGYRFISEPQKIQIPLAVDDLLERCKNNQLSVRAKKGGNPVIGFAGWANLSSKQHMRTIIKELPIRIRSLFNLKYKACTKGVLWRKKVIRILQKSSKVSLNLLSRSSFSANQKTAEGDVRKLRDEMVETILQSDYALDVRGDANNSARLFEILSLGRIPVIIDTERNFPFKDKVDYSSFALIVDFRDIKRLPEIIADFHKNVSPERFEEMQSNARAAFVKYFRIDAMMKHVKEDVQKRIKSV